MMVVVSITAILLAVGVPQFQHYAARKAVDSQIQALASAVRLTRAEAISRGRTVTLCRSITAENEAPTCAGDGDWSSGWIIFEDGGARSVVEAADTVIRVQPAFTNSGGIASSAANYTLSFLGTGLVVRGGGAVGFGATTFKIKPKLATNEQEGPLCKALVINAAGRTSKGACS